MPSSDVVVGDPNSGTHAAGQALYRPKRLLSLVRILEGRFQLMCGRNPGREWQWEVAVELDGLVGEGWQDNVIPQASCRPCRRN